jgi:LysR family transcriptional activator of nhaA
LQSVKLSYQGTPCAISCSVNGDVQVGLGILNHHVGHAVQHYPQLAAFVDTTARTVDIGQQHYYSLNVIIETGQCKPQAPFSVVAQGFGQGKIASLNIKLHSVPLFGCGSYLIGSYPRSIYLFRKFDYYRHTVRKIRSNGGLMVNYKHLHYFWVVARKGGVARASEHLHLTPQTISGQLSLLEEYFGVDLFIRVGRNLEITEIGRQVLSYADEIFSLGGELEEVIHQLPEGRPQLFRVGVVDVLPKSIMHRILKPVLQMPGPVRMICRETGLDALLAELAVHRLDLVLADRPIPPTVSARGFSHKLGECAVSFFATESLRKKLSGDFPACLDGAPLLLPSSGTQLRAGIDQWLERHRLHPRIIGEFDDSALIKAFGQEGAGIFTAPAAIGAEVESQYQVTAIGLVDEIKAPFFAITVERRVTHPVVSVVVEAARESLFADE